MLYKRDCDNIETESGAFAEKDGRAWANYSDGQFGIWCKNNSNKKKLIFF